MNQGYMLSTFEAEPNICKHESTSFITHYTLLVFDRPNQRLINITVLID